jgi:hypothetical protein
MYRMYSTRNHTHHVHPLNFLSFYIFKNTVENVNNLFIRHAKLSPTRNSCFHGDLEVKSGPLLNIKKVCYLFVFFRKWKENYPWVDLNSYVGQCPTSTKCSSLIVHGTHEVKSLLHSTWTHNASTVCWVNIIFIVHTL